MKRTISEVIDLIKQKKESAENTRKKHIDNKSKYASYIDTGYIEAYTDILALLESSHLVEQEKVLSVLKEMANGIKEMKNQDIQVKDLIMSISESTNELIKGWLNDRN